jgi:Domain of unknown function (DUF5658)
MWTYCVLVNIADYLTTRVYLAKVGFAGEASPWMRSAFEHSASLPLHIKLFILGLLGICLIVVRKEAYAWTGWALATINVFITAVVCWGIYCIGVS